MELVRRGLVVVIRVGQELIAMFKILVIISTAIMELVQKEVVVVKLVGVELIVIFRIFVREFLVQVFLIV